jgi:predicted dehydrogenase
VAALRLGLIGAGRWGRAYIRTIAGIDAVALAAVASGNPETQSLVPPGCLVTGDWRAMIAMPEVEAVIVATPPALHAAMATQAIEAGKPVLVEKPFTMNVGEAEAVAALARRHGVALMVEHTHLFAPGFRELVRRIPELGRLRHLRGLAGNEGPFRLDTPVLWDWGAHEVAMSLAIAGPPSAQSARLVERRSGVPHAESLSLSLNWQSGLEAEISLSNIAAPKRRRFEAAGERGSLIYDDMAQDKLQFAPASGRAIPIPVEARLPLTVAVAEFAAAARHPPDEAALALGLAVVRVLEACDAALAAPSPGAGR